MKQFTKTTILFGLLTALLLFSCKEDHVADQSLEADSLINIAYQNRNYDSILSLANLQQQEGKLSDLKACYWRGYAYSR